MAFFYPSDRNEYNSAIMAIAIFLLIILQTGFAQTIISYSNFTYTETFSRPNVTESPPHVLDIKHYADGTDTAVIRIGRINYYDGANTCLEQMLLLRILQTNGSVTEINYNNTDKIQEINYCYVNSNLGVKTPISIYPLFDKYILVTYTYATNVSDNTTFMDSGMVIDWSGNVISTIEFGPSYLFPNSSIWTPNEYFVNNIDPRKGFFRLSAVRGTNNFEWRQYGYNGSFNLLQNDTFLTDSTNITNFQVTVLQSLDNGYYIVYAETGSQDSGLYAVKLNYNKTTAAKFLLYQFAPNITLISIFCSIDYVYVGHSCYATMVNMTTSTNTTMATTEKIRFLSDGALLAENQIIPYEYSSNIRNLPLGGYVIISRRPFESIIEFNFSLYNEKNQLFNYEFPPNPIISNSLGVFDILHNNTMLVAQNESSTTWNLLSIQLPSLSFRNDSNLPLYVNATYPQNGSNNLTVNYNNTINITFQDPVSFANGKLYIYQPSSQGNILRQFVDSKTCTQCTALGNVVTLNVYYSTFDEPNGKYFIQMDYNFVQNSMYNEAILGIDQYVWTFQTANTDISQGSIDSGDIWGSLRLNKDGTQHFQELNNSEKSNFISTLINELTVMVPTENGRLSSNGHYQFNDNSKSNILISLSINRAKNGEKMLNTQLAKNLNQLIINGEHTCISTGTTTIYLDYNNGFQQTSKNLYIYN
ncbi:5431_t:CDS:2 [Dentiscutata erythropus]|uniref:5431_t:CDS:1 n=1 Tax=Dentiscutata erythropus TaxID=1348616 RepID=A0A9N9EAP5_9GLOM|nr:5431_t:CDS:2 [Dentiscutata erythropus]